MEISEKRLDLIKEYKSHKLLCIGVPVTHHRATAGILQHALEINDVLFLI